MSNAQFHFLTGENAGAAVVLDAGSYTLGNLNDCDLQINNKGEPCAVSFTIREDGAVQIKLITGRALLGHKELPNAWVTFEEQNVLNLNDNCITWAPEGTSLRAFDPQELKAEEPKPEPTEDEAKPEEAQSEAQAADTTSENQEAEPTAPENQANTSADAKTTPADTSDETSTVTASASQDQSSPNPDAPSLAAETPTLQKTVHDGLWYFKAALGGLGLCTTLSSLVAGSWLFTQESPEDLALAQAQSFLEQEKEFTLVSAQVDDGVLSYTGVVKDQEAAHAFVQALPQSPLPTVLKLKVYEEVLAALEHSSSLYGATIRASFNPDHERSIRLYGYIHDPYIEKSLIDTLSADFKDHKLIFEPHFVYVEELSPLVDQTLAHYALSKLNISFGPFALFYHGDLTLEDSKRLAAVQQHIERFLQAPLSLKDGEAVQTRPIEQLALTDFIYDDTSTLSKRDKDRARLSLRAYPSEVIQGPQGMTANFDMPSEAMTPPLTSGYTRASTSANSENASLLSTQTLEKFLGFSLKNPLDKDTEEKTPDEKLHVPYLLDQVETNTIYASNGRIVSPQDAFTFQQARVEAQNHSLYSLGSETQHGSSGTHRVHPAGQSSGSMSSHTQRSSLPGTTAQQQISASSGSPVSREQIQDPWAQEQNQGALHGAVDAQTHAHFARQQQQNEARYNNAPLQGSTHTRPLPGRDPRDAYDEMFDAELIHAANTQFHSSQRSRIGDNTSYSSFQSQRNLEDEMSAYAEPIEMLPPDSVAGVTMEPLRFITLRTGERYFEGTVLKNGYTLIQITVDHLVFAKGQQKIMLKLQ